MLSVVAMGGGGGRSALCTAARMSARAEMVAAAPVPARRVGRHAAMRMNVCSATKRGCNGKQLSDGPALVSYRTLAPENSLKEPTASKAVAGVASDDIPMMCRFRAD